MSEQTPKASPRLQFTNEERKAPELKKPIRKAEKAADKRDAVKVATKKKLIREKALDPATGKKITQLRFEEMQRKPPSKLHHPIATTASSQLHKQIGNSNEDGNSGVQAAHETEKAGEAALRMGERAHHAHKLRPYRQAAKAERQLDKANLRVMRAQAKRNNPQQANNPIAKWYQKRRIRKEYAAIKASGNAGKASASVTSKVSQFFTKRKGGMAIAALGFMMVFVLNGISACTPIVQTVINAYAIGTYPAEEADILAAERAYRNMENELQNEMDHYESFHPGHDEYRFELMDIWHDPHVLIAIISAYHAGEEWTIDSAYGTLKRYFELQYIVTETIERETRYRTEERTGQRQVTDPSTGAVTWVPYTYEVQVPYAYTICNVKLENKNLSHLPVYTMSRTNLGLYALYMSTLGNMPDLFRGNPYASTLKDPILYDVPEEALLADSQFALLIEEAEKYLGYPYVWGGDSPETSFDCSGFVSYVFTNSGVYNTGRLGATGLYGICRKITESEAQPGDLIFFTGTLGAGMDGNDGITHVGLYVGNGMMIHCGNPISYADLSGSYWQTHYYGYGRVPYERSTQ